MSTSKNELRRSGSIGLLTAVSGSKWGWLHFLLPLGTALFVYWLTLAPDLTWANHGADGGELMAAAVTLGAPHPPGYPMYVLLGKLFSSLPIGTIAYRFNLFSAVAVAVAAAFITAAARQLVDDQEPGRGKLWGLAAGLAFAFAPLVWGQAIIAEVYGLNLAVLAALLWALVGKRPSWLIGLLLGLGVTTHLTSWLMLPLALGLVPWRQWGRLSLGLAWGLTPLLALPWLAAGDGPVVWGEPTTLRGWWWLVSGRLYHPNVWAVAKPELWARWLDWSGQLARQFTRPGWLLVAFAFYRVKGEWLRWRLGMLGTAVLYLVYAWGYASSDAIVFILPALLLFSLLLAPGLQRLGRLALFLPLALLLLNYEAIDLSDDRVARPLTEPLLQAAPADAILLTPGDQMIFAFWYYQHVEKQRPDLILIDANLFAFDWYRARLQRRYPDLGSLDVDDLVGLRQTNEGKRPFCMITSQHQTSDYRLDCPSTQ